MFAQQYSMSPNPPSCPPMEPSYSTSSEDSIQSMPFYYASYPTDFELPFQPTSSPSYAPSYASSSLSASSYNSPAFSTCDYTTPPLAYSAQPMQTNNATYFAPMQSHCVWSAPAAPVPAAVASAGAMPPVEEVLITDADEVEMDMDTDLDRDLQQQYLMESPKSMPAPTMSMQMPMPIPIPTDFQTSPSACSSPASTSTSPSSTKPFSCDCGRAFTRPADLKRHQTSVHNPVFQDCPVEECVRKAGNGFPRRDHLIEHLRSYHHIDVPKRRAVKKGMKVSS